MRCPLIRGKSLSRFAIRFLLALVVAIKNNDAKTIGGASGFPFVVDEIVFLAKEDAAAKCLAGRGA
jgi:hypothetical protein